MKKNILLFLLCLPLWSAAQQWPGLRWEKHFGGEGEDDARMAIQAMDGSMVAVGFTASKYQRGSDILFVKMSPSDGAVFPSNHGGKEDDGANAVVESPDGGFLVAGFTESSWAGSLGRRDAWLVKFDEEGIPLWDAILGGGEDDEFFGLALTQDGSPVAAGHKGGRAYLVQLSPGGEVQWELTLDESPSLARALAIGNDGAIMAVGQMDGCAMLAAASPRGVLQWARTVEEKTFREGLDIISTRDGGWAVAGIALKGQYREEAVLLKLDGSGKEQWSRSYGGFNNDGGRGLIQTHDGKFILTGYSHSHQSGARTSKLFLLDVKESGETAGEGAFFFGDAHNDEGFKLALTREGKILVAGRMGVKGKDQGDAWLLEVDYPPKAYPSESPELRLGESRLVEGNGNQILEANERGYILFSVENTSDFEACGLRAAVSVAEDGQGIEFMDTILIGDLAGQSVATASIPVCWRESLQAEQQLLQVHIFGQSGRKLLDFDYPVRMAGDKKPFLEITESRFITQHKELPRRGEPIELEVSILNRGLGEATGVKTRFLLPFKVRELTERDLEVGDLGPGESATVRFSFQARSFYESDSIPIRCFVWDTTFSRVERQAFGIRIESFFNLEGEPEIIHRSRPQFIPFEQGRNGRGPSAPPAPVPLPEDDGIIIQWAAPDPFEEGLEIDHLLNYLNVKLNIRAPASLKVEDFYFLRNGKPYQTAANELQAGEMITRRKADYGYMESAPGRMYWYRYVGEVHFEPGMNKIQLAIQAGGELHVSEPLIVHYQPPVGRLFLYAIGIPQEDLLFTSKDAGDFAEAFNGQGGKLYTEVVLRTFLGKEETTKSNLEKEIGKIWYDYLVKGELDDHDTFMFYISSHGFEERRGGRSEFRIAASDFNNLLCRPTSLDFEEDLIEALTGLPNKKFIFIDACFSGAVANIDIKGGKSGSLPDSVELSKAIVRLAEANPEFYCLLSCSPGQLSYEDQSWNNSAFTKALLEALRNEEVPGAGGKITADSNNNGILTLSELYQFVRERVPVILSSRNPRPSTSQVPYMAEELIFLELPIFSY